MSANAAQASTFKQKVTIVAKGGNRRVTTRDISVTRKQLPKANVKKLDKRALPLKAASSAGIRKIHTNVLPGYPNATISTQDFGSTAVGQTSQTITLSYPYPAGVTSQELTFASGLNGFFGQATCNYPQPCTAPIAFQPTNPGLTTNAVFSTDQNGNVIYETFLSATGTAPQLGFDLGDLTEYDGVTNQPGHVAVGPDGSIYLTDSSQNAVYQFTSNLSSQTQLNITGLGTPGGIAVDGAGTVYIADKTNNVIVAYNVTTGAQATVRTSQLSNPNGVAVDGSGDLFIADTGNDRIIEIDPQGNETPYDDDIHSPTAIATDSGGNVYFADASNGGEVTEVSDGDITFATQLGTLYDIAVDAAGRVYISTSTGLALIEDEGTNEGFGGGPNFGMALTPNGDVITTQPGNSSVSVTDRSMSNFILYAEVGTTTHGGDAISNTGNQPLTLSNVAVSGTVAFTDDPNDPCTAGLTLQPGNVCHLIVDFSPPTAQAYTASYTATSNSLNVSTSMNVDTLYGNASGVPTATALTVAPNPAMVEQAVIFTASVTRTGNASSEPLPTGTVTFLDGGSTMLGTGTLDSGGNAQFTTSSLAAGTHSITASYAGDNYNAFSTSPAQSLVIGGGTSGPGSGATTNLLLNPGAELGSLQDWTIIGPGTPTVDTGTFDSGINPHTGTYDFLGQSGASDGLYQTVSALQQGITAAQLDNGSLSAQISFWEQGLSQGDPSDDGSVTLTFLDTNNATISTVNSGTIDSHDGSWQNGTGTYAIPTGTRSITYTMNFVRNQGSDLDTFIDDNSLIITPNLATAPSATTLTSTPAAPSVGQTVTFTVSVAGTTQTAPVPTGTVTLTNTSGGVATTLGTITLSGGTGTFNTSSLAAGSYSVTGAYGGDATYEPSVSAADTFTVSPVAGGTVTTLALSATTAAYEKAITMTANVAIPSGASVEVGQVAFCDAAAVACNALMSLGVAQLGSDEPAVFRLPGATIGQHQYIAKFLGTTTYSSSVSSAQSIAITGLYPTSTTITATGTGGTYSLTGTVVGLGANALSPTGVVSFLDTSNANASLGTAELGASTLGFNETQPAGSPVTVGAGPYGQATGDFNGDGFLDLAVENYTAGTVSVLLGNGDGTFQTAVTYSVGTQPERVLVADLNGDGHLDLIVANTGSQSISVLLGNGDGTFQDQVTYQCGSPVGLGVMDINHDGIPDVVAGDYYDNTISVLLGNGDGTLKAAVTYPTGNTPQTVAEGDFNGDGNTDVVVGNYGDGTVGVFLGNGDGTFQTMVTYTVGRNPQGVQVGDFNGDGFDDLAVSNSGDGTVSVLLGKGDGTFQAQVNYTVGEAPVGLAIADFNGDGFQDITVGNTGQSSLTQGVLLGNGDGTFKPQVTFPTGNFPYGVSTGDFNGDGYPDIGVSNFSAGTVTILLSQVTNTATATTSVTVGGSGTTHAVEASYPGDTNFGPSVSQPTTLTGGGTTTAPTLISLSPAGGVTGSPATTLTLTGTNFAATDLVRFGDNTLVSTYVNATTLTAVIPATLFVAPATYPVTIIDTATELGSNQLNFVVSTAPMVVFTGPSTATSGQQPVVTFQLLQPYAVPINCLLTLTFTPLTPTGIVDPSVQFSSGGTTISVTIPAGSTVTPPVEFQAGTVAGTVTVTLTITDANGDPLTPPNVAPVVVTLPGEVPQITNTAAARATEMFTVTVVGFSNTREVKTAIFHFTPMPGATLSDADVTVDVTGIFAQWYQLPESTQYGSSFTYTQPFNLNADPATIQSVTVTLVNAVGDSVVTEAASAQ